MTAQPKGAAAPAATSAPVNGAAVNGTPAQPAPSGHDTASLINSLARQEMERLHSAGFTDDGADDTDTEASGGEDTAPEGINAPRRDRADEAEVPEDEPTNDASPQAEGDEPAADETADPTTEPPAEGDQPEATPETEPETETPADPDTAAIKAKFPRLKPEEQAALGAKIAEERRKAIAKQEAATKELQERVEQLTANLDEVRNATPPPREVPLPHVTADKLGEFERGLTDLIELSDEAMLDVRDDPEGVAALFKTRGIAVPEDTSADTMKKWLHANRSTWKSALKQVPLRKEYLETQRQIVPALAKMFPALADKGSALSQSVQQVVDRFPALKAHPAYQVEAVKYLLGHQQFEAMLKGGASASPNGKPLTATASKPPPSPPRRGVAPAVSPAKSRSASDAEKKFRETGSPDALVEMHAARYR